MKLTDLSMWKMKDNPNRKLIFRHWENDFMRCYWHYVKYVMSGKKYKSYRRGKNRCLKCGLKK